MNKLGLLLLLPTFLADSVFADEPSSLDIFDRVSDSYIMVASHRGGYLSNGSITHPENSISAILNSIELGVDIIEIDFRMTSDGEVVAMHDSTVNRTTTGSGAVSSLAYSEIADLRLIGPNGSITQEMVPTLKQVMEAAKGNVLVNFDKVNVTNTTLMDRIMEVLIETDTVDHAIFKGGASADQVQAVHERFPGESITYMPIVSNQSEANLISSLSSHGPPAVELIFGNDNTPMLGEQAISTAKQLDTHIWINSLWPSISGGHHDGRALAGDPDGAWGWLVDNGATIIQTDNSPQLLEYLEQRDLRNYVPRSEPPLIGDFNDDRVVDLADWRLFVQNQTTDLTDLSMEEAARVGDLNRNGQHDLGDFVLFRKLLESASVSLETSSIHNFTKSVPEPSGEHHAICLIGLTIVALKRGTMS